MGRATITETDCDAEIRIGGNTDRGTEDLLDRYTKTETDRDPETRRLAEITRRGYWQRTRQRD